MGTGLRRFAKPFNRVSWTAAAEDRVAVSGGENHESGVVSAVDATGESSSGGLAPAAEASLGKPVVTGNRAMMHAALKRIGVPPGECACAGRLAGCGIPEVLDDPP